MFGVLSLDFLVFCRFYVGVILGLRLIYLNGV